jgi:hypothetical protein
MNYYDYFLNTFKFGCLYIKTYYIYIMNSFMDFGIHLACLLLGRKFMPESLLILPNERAIAFYSVVRELRVTKVH